MRYHTDELAETFTIELDESIADAADRLRDLETMQLAVTSADRIVGMITEKGIIGCVAENHVAWKCEVFRHMDMQN